MRTVDDDTIRRCREVMAHHAKSFDFAARLLGPAERDAAAVYYAWCRHVDDAVDEVPESQAPAALRALRAELKSIEADERTGVLAVDAFAIVRRRYGIPMLYAEELIEGMAMDVRGDVYESTDSLLRYCHRVAGVVGLTMCHVLGLRDGDGAALRNAAHMGWAMQLTNICRDVEEDWRRRRLYLPRDLLRAHGWSGAIAGALPRHPAFARVMEELLSLADRYYASGDRGLLALPPRSALAVDAARRIYSAIGNELEAAGFDPHRGRAFVRRRSKVRHAALALASALARRAARKDRGVRFAAPSRTARFDELVGV